MEVVALHLMLSICAAAAFIQLLRVPRYLNPRRFAAGLQFIWETATRPDYFKAFFRLKSIEQFLELHALVAPHLNPLAQSSTMLRLAIALFYLASGCSLKVTATVFKSSASAMRYVDDFVDVIINKFYDSWVTHQNDDLFSAVTRVLSRKVGGEVFFRAIGAVDGTFVDTVMPKTCRYFGESRKGGRTKLLILAVVDLEGVFRYVGVVDVRLLSVPRSLLWRP